MSKKKYFLFKGDEGNEEDDEIEVEYLDGYSDLKRSSDVLLSDRKKSNTDVISHCDSDEEDRDNVDVLHDHIEIDLNDTTSTSTVNNSHNNNNNNSSINGMTIINLSDDPFSDTSHSSGYSTSLSNWRNIIRNYRVNRNSSSSSSHNNSNSSPITNTFSTPPPSLTSPPITSPTATSHFPFPTSDRWESSHLKGKDAILLKLPGGSVSLGLNESKFYHHLRTGEHDPNGLYFGLADPDVLLQQFNRAGSTTPDNITYLSEYDGFIHSGNFESYRRRKFLVSLLTCEIFYSALLMAEVMQFNSVMLMLASVILCNIVGLFALTRNRFSLFNFFLLLNVGTIIIQVLGRMFTPLFILRLLALMIGIRVRHEMILGDY